LLGLVLVRFVGKTDLRGIPPKPIEIVKRSGLVLKDVQDHVRVIQEEPAGRFSSFDTEGPNPVYRKVFFYSVGYGSNLGF